MPVPFIARIDAEAFVGGRFERVPTALSIANYLQIIYSWALAVMPPDLRLSRLGQSYMLTTRWVNAIRWPQKYGGTMRNMKTCLLGCLGMIVFSTVTFAEPHTTTGTIQSISINDHRNLKGMDSTEKPYIVTIQLDSATNKVFGLLPSNDGELVGTQYAIFHLLQDAFFNKWKVTIRWDGVLSSHAPILAVTIPKQ